MRVLPAQEMPWQAQLHPKGSKQGRQSCQQQCQAWQGMKQGPAGHQSGWKRDAAVHISLLGRGWHLQCQDAPRRQAGQQHLQHSPGLSWKKAHGQGVGGTPLGGSSGQLKPSHALKAPLSQSNYVIYHCLSSSWHRFFIDHFSFPY